MPELPEVQTTVSGLSKALPGLRILDVWTDIAVKKPALRHYDDTVKNLKFFNFFRAQIKNQKIIKVTRRAKNILIYLSKQKVILIHMKMTGHLLYGPYKKEGRAWKPKVRGPLDDPYNRFIHVLFFLSNGKHLAFSDARKFGKITLIAENDLNTSPHLGHLGPEPLDKNFDVTLFKSRLLKKPNGRIKQVLCDQTIVSGIGNIYSDEMLWYSRIHPLSRVKNIPEKKFVEMFKAMKKVLKAGIDFGGDSLSDYRDIYGREGKFQLHHKVYQRMGEKCSRCGSIIKRIKLGGRSAHFCPKEQKLY